MRISFYIHTSHKQQISDKKYKFLLYATGLENALPYFERLHRTQLPVRFTPDDGKGIRFLRDSLPTI
ncbi:hypothetical protein [Bacteroides sp. 14(A)]|uniref:hypothetical protein n=1 Tax=Bacteroides sp. 14(A) TaxID=1163670 RepID=UPI001E5ECAE6|nr:hypothetical protein [Bacteroides sp. 14(A)]